MWEFTAAERDQIWAEAKSLWQSGERLYLEGNMITAAQEAQREAMEVDERQGIVETYLDVLLPINWDYMELWQRRSYLGDPTEPTQPQGVAQRECVFNAEIW